MALKLNKVPHPALKLGEGIRNGFGCQASALDAIHGSQVVTHPGSGQTQSFRKVVASSAFQPNLVIVNFADDRPHLFQFITGKSVSVLTRCLRNTADSIMPRCLGPYTLSPFNKTSP